MIKLFHYTNGTKIRAIIDSNTIEASPKKPKPREKAVCWFSSNPLWEKTANKIVMTGSGESKLLNMDETNEICGGLFRFVIDSEQFINELYPYPRLATVARIPDKIKKLLLKRAKKCGVKPEEWWGIIGPVPVDRTTLEQYVDGKWVPVDMNTAKPTETGLNVVSGVTMKYLPTKDSEWDNV